MPKVIVEVSDIENDLRTLRVILIQGIYNYRSGQKVVRDLLSKAPGIIVIDDPKKNIYPMPKDAEGKDETFVGRIRCDCFVKNGLWLWVVADNLRKGAATNAVQIAEELIKG